MLGITWGHWMKALGSEQGRPKSSKMSTLFLFPQILSNLINISHIFCVFQTCQAWPL